MSGSHITAAGQCETLHASTPTQGIHIIQADQIAPQTWRNGGGKTRELLLWPTPGSVEGNAFCAGKGGARAAGGGHGAERIAFQTPSANQSTTTTDNTTKAAEWQLRISRADIEADGPFSAFAGVQRWFAVLSGKGVVLHMPTPDGHTLDHHLLPGHTPLHFDGGLAPGCSLIDGATQDLNLMARGGQACMQPVVAGEPWLSPHSLCGLYTVRPGIWSDGLQSLPLAAHTLLWCPQGAPSAMRFTPHNSEPPQAYWLGYTPDATP